MLGRACEAWANRPSGRPRHARSARRWRWVAQSSPPAVARQVTSELVRDLEGNPVWIVDRIVASLAASSDGRTLQLRGGERSKRTSTLERLIAWMADLQVERSDPLVAIGGGTISDLAG